MKTLGLLGKAIGQIVRDLVASTKNALYGARLLDSDPAGCLAPLALMRRAAREEASALLQIVHMLK